MKKCFIAMGLVFGMSSYAENHISCDATEGKFNEQGAVINLVKDNSTGTSFRGTSQNYFIQANLTDENYVLIRIIDLETFANINATLHFANNKASVNRYMRGDRYIAVECKN